MKLFFDKQTDFGKSITEFVNIDVIIGIGNNDNIGLEDLPTDIWINFIINQLLTRDVIKESELEIDGVESFIDFYMDI